MVQIKVTQKQSENDMCLYPRLIENRKYKSTKKNGGKIPTIIDKRALFYEE